MYRIHPQAAEVPVALPEPSYLQWYAISTRSRHEKCVGRLLEGKSIGVGICAAVGQYAKHATRHPVEAVLTGP